MCSFFAALLREKLQRIGSGSKPKRRIICLACAFNLFLRVSSVYRFILLFAVVHNGQICCKQAVLMTVLLEW